MLPSRSRPTLLHTLNGQAPAKNDAVVRLHAPGVRMRYSGGGVTVEQLAIENATGQPLEAIARAGVRAAGHAPQHLRQSAAGNVRQHRQGP